MDVSALNRLNEKQLRNVLSSAKKIINKRIKSLESKNMNSPALRALIRSGGPITTKGANLNRLRSEYSRARKFLTAKTSTVTGVRKVRQELSKRLKIELTEKQEDNFWKVYNKLKEDHPDVYSQTQGSTRLQNIIADISSGGNYSIDEMLDKANKELTRIYEETIQYNPLSEIFDFWEDV